MKSEIKYNPGVCNINSYEVNLRLKSALISFLISLLGLIFLLIFVSNDFIRVVLIGPIFLTVLNIIQSKNKFCVFYGLKHEENSQHGEKIPSKIKNRLYILKDKKKSIKIIFVSLLISVFLTSATIFIPSIN